MRFILYFYEIAANAVDKRQSETVLIFIYSVRIWSKIMFCSVAVRVDIIGHILSVSIFKGSPDYGFIHIQLPAISRCGVFIRDIAVVGICVVFPCHCGIVCKSGCKAKQTVRCSQRSDRKDKISCCIVDIPCSGQPCIL